MRLLAFPSSTVIPGGPGSPRGPGRPIFPSGPLFPAGPSAPGGPGRPGRMETGQLHANSTASSQPVKGYMCRLEGRHLVLCTVWATYCTVCAVYYWVALDLSSFLM